MSSRKRSAVWNHFSEVDPKKARCTYCSNTIGISGGNVGNLNRHLKTKHPTVSLVPARQEELAPPPPVTETISVPSTSTDSVQSACPVHPTPTPTQPSMVEFVNNMKPIGPRRSEKVDEQLIKMIAKGHHPFSIVEEPEFKKLLAMLCGGYSLPTRKSLSNNLLPQMYNRELIKARAKVASVSAICLTTDGWTSINNEHFIAITAHYIKNSQLHSTMIGCVQYPDRATAANLASHMRNVLEEWAISDKVTAIASDNGANIVAAIRARNWRHVACFAHTLNLCVQNALVPISETTAKVKQVVEYFKRSSQALAKLRELQGQLNVPQLKLKQDVVTRFNSTYLRHAKALGRN
ncbi:hypothetical protein PYW08_012981 [Mythimna loreyi]|uniref:Uncharacterized protein n=1 Tax=Mythimna loreyi TaxID=667449 RepID=A0ACC2PYX9_9NEOP|nr:hypothetical protein PYW08_012981 [Mythimna loreyi]